MVCNNVEKNYEDLKRILEKLINVEVDNRDIKGRFLYFWRGEYRSSGILCIGI